MTSEPSFGHWEGEGLQKYGNVIDVINTKKEFDSHILQNLRNVKGYTFKDPGLISSKKGGKKTISWAGLGQRGKEEGHPWWRNYRQFGCRVVWSNIFVKVFKHEWSRIVGDTKLDAFGFKLCSFKIVLGNYVPLRKIYKRNGCPKHKNVLTNLCIFKSLPNRIFPPPLPLITCLQEYPPRNIFLKFYHERVYLVWVRDLKIL